MTSGYYWVTFGKNVPIPKWVTVINGIPYVYQQAKDKWLMLQTANIGGKIEQKSS